MSVIVWVSAGVAVWLLAGVLLGLVFGRVIRNRDTQVPREQPQAEPACPELVTAGEPAGGRP